MGSEKQINLFLLTSGRSGVQDKAYTPLMARPFTTFRMPVGPHLCFAHPTRWTFGMMFSVLVLPMALTSYPLGARQRSLRSVLSPGVNLFVIPSGLPLVSSILTGSAQGRLGDMGQGRTKIMVAIPITENGDSYWESGGHMDGQEPENSGFGWRVYHSAES